MLVHSYQLRWNYTPITIVYLATTYHRNLCQWFIANMEFDSENTKLDTIRAIAEAFNDFDLLVCVKSMCSVLICPGYNTESIVRGEYGMD